jgi:hypothetical protein
VSNTAHIHDFNPGFGPKVSAVDSGNGFGTRVFWTAVVPDNAVQIDPQAGTVKLHVANLPKYDYYSPSGFAGMVSLGPQWQTAWLTASVSFDVVWNAPVTRVVNVHDSTFGFAGTFLANQATITWSGSNPFGFSFTANPGDFATSVPEVPGVNGVTQPLNYFAEIGFEQNGVFFPRTPSSPFQSKAALDQTYAVLARLTCKDAAYPASPESFARQALAASNQQENAMAISSSQASSANLQSFCPEPGGSESGAESNDCFGNLLFR